MLIILFLLVKHLEIYMYFNSQVYLSKLSWNIYLCLASKLREKNMKLLQHVQKRRTTGAYFLYWVHVSKVRQSIDNHFHLKLQIRLVSFWSHIETYFSLNYKLFTENIIIQPAHWMKIVICIKVFPGNFWFIWNVSIMWHWIKIDNLSSKLRSRLASWSLVLW